MPSFGNAFTLAIGAVLAAVVVLSTARFSICVFTVDLLYKLCTKNSLVPLGHGRTAVALAMCSCRCRWLLLLFQCSVERLDGELLVPGSLTLSARLVILFTNMFSVAV